MDSGKAWEEARENGQANPFDNDGIILTIYSFAIEKADAVAGVLWNLAVFEEAHHLKRITAGQSEGAAVLRQVFEKPFKLLLTATPLRNSILDLYDLVQFIDDRVFDDADDFISGSRRTIPSWPAVSENTVSAPRGNRWKTMSAFPAVSRRQSNIH